MATPLLGSLSSIDSGSSSSLGRSSSSFTVSPGVAADVKDLSPVDCFLQLFDQCVLELLHKETLRYLEQYLEDNKEHLDEDPNARVHDLARHPITLEDMEVLIAILVGMGICGFLTVRLSTFLSNFLLPRKQKSLEKWMAIAK